MPKRQQSSVSKELKAVLRSVGSLQQALARLVPLFANANGNVPSKVVAKPRRRLRLSPRRRAALKLQGQYMGYLRGLRPRQKARVKALAAAKGVRAAVGLARGLARS